MNKPFDRFLGHKENCFFFDVELHTMSLKLTESLGSTWAKVYVHEVD